MPANSTNPWSATGWNLTKQGEIVKRYGIETAERMAKAVGSFIGAQRPRTVEKPKVYIIKGRQGPAGSSGAVHPILGFTAEGPFAAKERFALAPPAQAIRFPAGLAALSSATCLFKPTVTSAFVLTTEPDEYLANGDAAICTVTFVAGSQIGSFAWGSLVTVPVATPIYIIAPFAADATLGGVSILFRGDPA